MWYNGWGQAICGGYKLRGKHTCGENFLPSEVIEPAVFETVCKEVAQLDTSTLIGEAGERLDKAPFLAERRKEDLRRELCEVEERLNTLLECITPENKELITEKMVALRGERDRLKAELADSETIKAKAVSSTKLVSRMVKLATELQELWAVARLEEKREFLSYLITSISICPERKIAEIELSSKYAELRRLAAPESGKTFLSDGRGDWRSFEPRPRIIAPYVSCFNRLPEPSLAIARQILERSA